MRKRNFAACCLIIFCAFAVLYANSTSLPALLQSLRRKLADNRSILP